MTPRRKLLVRSQNIATRQRVYRIAEGLEVDDIDHFEVRRSRVFFDDVLLITFHRYRGPVLLVLNALVVVVVGVIAAVSGSAAGDITVGVVIFAIFGVPFLLVFLIHLIFGWDEINVYGRRSRAALRFGFRKQFARRLYEELINAIRAAQSKVATSTAPAEAPPPPPPAEEPLPPPDTV